MALLHVEDTIAFSYDGQRTVYRVPAGFHIDVGEKVCISGVSGSGKSTILTMLAGLRRLVAGEIHYQVRPGRFMRASWRQAPGPALWGEIGFIFQRPELLSAMTVEDNLRFAVGADAASWGQRLFPDVVHAVNGQTCRINEWEEVRHKRPSALSGGQKLRAGLVRAFGKGQRLVVLDEPTAALDQDNRASAVGFIRERAATIGLLIVSHDEDFVRGVGVDRVFHIGQFAEDGRMVRSLQPALAAST